MSTSQIQYAREANGTWQERSYSAGSSGHVERRHGGEEYHLTHPYRGAPETRAIWKEANLIKSRWRGTPMAQGSDTGRDFESLGSPQIEANKLEKAYNKLGLTKHVQHVFQAEAPVILTCARRGLKKGLVNRKFLMLSYSQAVKGEQLNSKLF